MARKQRFLITKWLLDCTLIATVAVGLYWLGSTVAVGLYWFGYPKLAAGAFAGFWFFNGALFGFWSGRRDTIRKLKENARRFEQELRS